MYRSLSIRKITHVKPLLESQAASRPRTGHGKRQDAAPLPEAEPHWHAHRRARREAGDVAVQDPVAALAEEALANGATPS